MNETTPFVVSLAELRADADAFNKFHNAHYKQIDNITKVAYSSLSNLVKTLVGHKQFETAKKEEQDYYQKYLAEKTKYDNKKKTCNAEIEPEKFELSKMNGEKMAIDIEIKFVKNIIDNDIVELNNVNDVVQHLTQQSKYYY